MERFAWKGRIKPGMQAEYKRRHDDIWPEMLELLKAAKEQGYEPATIGIDTWGVDFVLLDKDGNRVGEAVH